MTLHASADPARTMPLGGFFGMEPPGHGGLIAHWRVSPHMAWENATSALAALIRHLQPGRVWLPGYLCRWTLDAMPKDRLRFFPLTGDLSPDLLALHNVAVGDLVLAVDYFGRVPGPDWCDFVAGHPDVTFVEDAAQALDTGVAPWGDWRLYSPRKLMGVPEGGLLVACSAKALAEGMAGPKLAPDPDAVARRRAPMQARAADPVDNSQWTALHDGAEGSFGVTDRSMDPAAFDRLATLNPAPMAAARRENFSYLAGRLGTLALLADRDPAFAPLGLPILLAADQRDATLRTLYARRIFPAVHWRDLAAPIDFTRDHALAAAIVTLPCDHRYGLGDMDRLATAVLEVTS